jgi:2-keto-4-pentenoate hydratase
MTGGDVNMSPLASLLLEHRSAGTQIASMNPGLTPKSLEEAYCVQQEVARQVPGGMAGWKIGMTSEAGMKARGMVEPVYARLFTATTAQPGWMAPPMDGRKLLEAEYVVELSADLPRGSYSIEELHDATNRLRPGIELCASRFVNKAPLDILLSLADNSYHLGLVVGEPIEDWRSSYLDRSVRLLANNGQVSQGTARNVLGDPFKALQWLASTDLPDGGLKAGDLIATGAIAVLDLTSDAVISVADFGDWGQVWATFQ